ncbi:FG-GAP-like repeat-containing protein [Kitasatospora sp. MMS16-BH015]|uniref:FG-GAP-like repeat-containing protein n=1 Tax=Kitasatospora sp. MMS16-BH015 TaxID=2018025 RepID=UPI0027389580|nr:FG-GAP-like repeat-containing protein [Kitasatospora sp. MMS16-BH015]
MAIAAAILTAGPLLSALVVSPASAASVSTWDKVAQCESTSDWSLNTGNGKYGGLQIISSTWAAFGGTAYAPQANLATKQQQILVAEKILAAQTEQAWPTCGPAAGLGADHADPYPASSTPLPARTAVGDFTGDHKLDVVGIDAYNNLNVYPGDGAGHLGGGTAMLGSNGAWAGFKAIAAGDFNRDGKMDVAGIDANDSLKLYTGDGAGHVSGGTAMLGGNGAWAGFKAITAGDFDGDGIPDIVGIDANNALKFYKGDGAGHVSGGSTMFGSNGSWAGFKTITAGDFNGDNRLDIAGIDANDNLELYVGDGAGHVSGGSDMLGNTGNWVGFRSAMGGDFNGDGKWDIAGIDKYNNMNLYTGDAAGHVGGGAQMIGGSGLWAGF